MAQSIVFIAAIAIVVAGSASPAHAQPSVPGCAAPTSAHGTYHPLTFPGITDIIPAAINDKGDIVGTLIRTDDQHVHGFLYRHGGLRLIDIPGSATTNLIDINDKGTIVGRFDTHGFVLRRGMVTTVDAPGAFETNVYAINNRNLIGGLALEPNGFDGMQVGFIRQPDGSFERIVPPGSDNSLVKDLDDHGTLLVNASFGQLLRIDGQYEPIPPCHPLDAVVKLSNVSNRLALVGNTVDAAGTVEGMLRTATTFELFAYPGSIQTVLLDVNEKGTAIGTAVVPDVGAVAFVFVPSKKR